MTALENIVLCDNGYREVQEVKTAQKIKLRSVSYDTISTKYVTFTGKTTGIQDTSSQPVSDVEITNVVAISPTVAEMIKLLEIRGKIIGIGHKALKVKPIMYDNMKRNSTSDSDIAAIEEQAQASSSLHKDTPTVEPILDPEANTTLPEEDRFRVSRNGATAAKVEKYIEPSQQIEFVPETKTIEPVIEPEQPSPETRTVSPVVIEKENSRPLSRDVPLVAPERIDKIVEEKIQESAKEPTLEGLEKISTAININNLEILREYLAKTAQLKAEAEKAKKEEAEAKESAERAEKEAADSRNELVKTAERIAAHQETLIVQTEQSHTQASIYEAKRDEYEAERNEYQKAIDDMLAIMEEEPQASKTRVL